MSDCFLLRGQHIADGNPTHNSLTELSVERWVCTDSSIARISSEIVGAKRITISKYRIVGVRIS